MATKERIPASSLPKVANGDIVYADEYNRNLEVIRQGVNANYSDIEDILQEIQGLNDELLSTVVGNAGSDKVGFAITDSRVPESVVTVTQAVKRALDYVDETVVAIGAGDMRKAVFATNSKVSQGYVDKAIMADTATNATNAQNATNATSTTESKSSKIYNGTVSQDVIVINSEIPKNPDTIGYEIAVNIPSVTSDKDSTQVSMMWTGGSSYPVYLSDGSRAVYSDVKNKNAVHFNFKSTGSSYQFVIVSSGSSSFDIPISETPPSKGKAYAKPITNVFETNPALPITLLASAWSDGVQTINVQGLKANQRFLIGVDQTLSDEVFVEECAAISAAGFRITNESANELVFHVTGTVPTINIHLVGGVV